MATAVLAWPRQREAINPRLRRSGAPHLTERRSQHPPKKGQLTLSEELTCTAAPTVRIEVNSKLLTFPASLP